MVVFEGLMPVCNIISENVPILVTPRLFQHFFRAPTPPTCILKLKLKGKTAKVANDLL